MRLRYADPPKLGWQDEGLGLSVLARASTGNTEESNLCRGHPTQEPRCRSLLFESVLFESVKLIPMKIVHAKG